MCHTVFIPTTALKTRKLPTHVDILCLFSLEIVRTIEIVKVIVNCLYSKKLKGDSANKNVKDSSTIVPKLPHV